MKDKISLEQAKAILTHLDEAIEQGPWDKSNFLRAIGKNLLEIREKLANELHLPEERSATAELINRMALHSGHQEVFIGLYSTEGGNLVSWERIVINLPRQMISRPIYSAEEDIKTIISLKENKMNEAYIAVYIDKNDILPVSPDRVPIDKLGKPLLSLKAKSISLENIGRFVHHSGVYHYTHGRLVKAAEPKTE